jgi:hypothetical protein
MACPEDLGSCLKLQGGQEIIYQYSEFGALFNNVLPNVYIAAGLIIFFMILIGGFTIITNAGSKDKVQDGQKIITSAIIGLVVLFASYWIIQIIQVLTGVQILNSGL